MSDDQRDPVLDALRKVRWVRRLRLLLTVLVLVAAAWYARR